jgi:glycosyltransferase involved in cell wall biosynthesis
MSGSTIKFLGHLDEQSLRESYAHCGALLFPREEDFGMVRVEAQDHGRPRIAYGQAGAIETTADELAHDCRCGSLYWSFFERPDAESCARRISRSKGLKTNCDRSSFDGLEQIADGT